MVPIRSRSHKGEAGMVETKPDERRNQVISFTISPDKGIAMTNEKPALKGQGRPMNPIIKGYIDKFASMKPGESFFVADAKSNDLEFLRKPFARAGLGVLIRWVETDEIYCVPGVRVWRLAGEYDEL